MDKDVIYFERTTPLTPTSIKIVRGKRVLNNAKVNLIFWGSAWQKSKGLQRRRKEILRDAKNILGSSYMKELKQYGINEPATFNNDFVVTTSEPTSNFERVVLFNFVNDLASQQGISHPGKYLHFVIMPPGITNNKEGGNFHFFPRYRGNKKLYIACIFFGSRAEISSGFSHELVEMCTDPDGKGIRVRSSNEALEQDLEQKNEDEIADLCESVVGRPKIAGVDVEPYWSNVHLSCIIPK